MTNPKKTKRPRKPGTRATREVQSSPSALGGKARAALLSPTERQDIARTAAAARWAKSGGVPRATHEGVLKIGDVEFPCSVLEDQTRVLSETRFMEGLGMYRSGALSTRRKDGAEGGARVPLYLAHKNLQPYVLRHLTDVHRAPLMHRGLKGNLVHGIRADLIPKICEIWLDARADGVLGAAQMKVASRAEALLRGLAHVGIVALVDEATGFQADRDRQALQAILDRFLQHELAAWAKRFPDEFYRHIFRLRGWQWRGMSVNRPQVVARYTNDIVYERLAPGILAELESRMPRSEDGRKRGRYHQLLTDDVGHPALAQHLHAVVGLMRVAKSWDQLKSMLDIAFPKRGNTVPFQFMSDAPALPLPSSR